MRIVMVAAAAAILAGAVVSGQASAATPAQSKMQQCAAQWQTMKKANKTGGQDYKTFSSTCMKGTTAAPAVTPVPMAKPVAGKPAAAVVPTASKAPAGDRMKQCAAQWQTMKAQNKTNGMTYKQWSSQCLKTH